MTSSPSTPAPGGFVAEAYGLDSEESLVAFYEKWARDYDRQMLDQLGYISPQTIAGLLLEQLKDQNAQVLDLGCGTGLSSVLLFQKGFRQIDGIDLSPQMLQVARHRNIYRALVAGDLNAPLPFASHSYEAAISSGTFTHGHVGPEPLDEICRVLKPEGLLACTVHQDLWQERGFEPAFQRLVDTGVIECLSLHRDKYYKDGVPEGWFCLYRKL